MYFKRGKFTLRLWLWLFRWFIRFRFRVFSVRNTELTYLKLSTYGIRLT